MAETKKEKLHEKLKEKELYGLTDFFKVLGDPTRVRILLEITGAEICVGDIANRLQISESAVSHHLQVLKMNRLVKRRRKGKMIFYSLSDHHVYSVIAQAKEHVLER